MKIRKVGVKMRGRKRILAFVMAMVIGLSGFSSMSAADSSLQTAGLMQAMASQQTAEAVELPAKLASAAYSAASDSVILKENTDPLKIHDQMTGETYNGQWLEFQVSVPEDGKYAFTARVQSPAGERPRMDVWWIWYTPSQWKKAIPPEKGFRG